MEFLDLKTQQKRIRKPLEKRINKILDHGAYIMGPEVFELEEKLADYCGAKHAISCSSGTDALLIPLMAWGIGPGDAVFTTPFTYVATAEVISILGATPVFVDVYESTFNIDCEKLETEINKVINDGKLKPKAIIPVDLFGLPARYRLIDKIAKKYEEQTSPYYAAARLWVDAIIDPVETRKIISLGIECANHNSETKRYNPGVIQS